MRSRKKNGMENLWLERCSCFSVSGLSSLHNEERKEAVQDTKLWSGECGFGDTQNRDENMEGVQWKKELARDSWPDEKERQGKDPRTGKINEQEKKRENQQKR